jgi:hypothetical protein
MRKLYIIQLLIYIALFQVKATAQVQLITTVPITVPTVLDLEFKSGQNPSANFSTTTIADAGITLSPATILTYKSNKAFHVTIQAGAPNFSSSPTTSTIMPPSMIQYRLTGGSTYTALSFTTAASLDGAAGSNARSTGNISIDYYLNPGYIYEPALYTMNIVYTISNP